MGTFLLLAVVFAVVFGGIAVAAWMVMDRALRRVVVDRHQVLEEILRTGEVPAAWRGEDVPARIRRLDRLRRYVERSSLVESESVRQEVLARLAEARTEWTASAGRQSA